MTPDLVALSVGIVPDGTEELSKLLKVPLTDDKFFLEAHVKLRPVELPVDGVYVCGLAHGPKPLDETIAQAQAAAAKAAIPLVKGHVSVAPIVSSVDQEHVSAAACASACVRSRPLKWSRSTRSARPRPLPPPARPAASAPATVRPLPFPWADLPMNRSMPRLAAFGEVREKETAEVA